jgi:hypothetical protein
VFNAQRRQLLLQNFLFIHRWDALYANSVQPGPASCAGL